MEVVIQANQNLGDIAAVFATFDDVDIGAAQVIREAGLEEHIVVVGIDGDPEAYAEMKKNSLIYCYNNTRPGYNSKNLCRLRT